MPKAKKSKAAARSHHKKPTSARLLKNRPVDKEPPETEENEATEAEEDLETPENPKPKRGRQARLPGTEDAAIESLEALAEEYAEARDERMAIGERESDLKQKLLTEMHANGKTKYLHAGVEIEVIATDEKVKVRIKKDE